MSPGSKIVVLVSSSYSRTLRGLNSLRNGLAEATMRWDASEVEPKVMVMVTVAILEPSQGLLPTFLAVS
jgi:hypothetical protein